MRCTVCDKGLTDFESTRKYVNSNGKTEYVDMCNQHFRESGLDEIVEIIERHDLSREEDIEGEFDDVQY